MVFVETKEEENNHIIRLQFDNSKALARVEMHHVMPQFKHYTLPNTHVVKQCLSQYFFNQAYHNKPASSVPLNAWMTWIYQLNAHFSVLDRLLNRPQALSKLIAELLAWMDGITLMIQQYQDSHDQPYIHGLLNNHQQALKQSLEYFIAKASTSHDLINLYAQHDMSLDVLSLGRWSSIELYRCLSLAYKGAKQLRKASFKHLFIQDPALMAIVSAQDLIYEQAFGFQGLTRVHPYHPIDQNLAHRLQIKSQDTIQYQMPKHDLHQMEHMVANLFNLSLNQFQSGNHLLISAAQFFCLPYELALMLVDVLARMIWILPYSYFHPNQAQEHTHILEHWHQHLSLYQRLQQLKNQRIDQDWKQKLPNHTQALDLLHLGLEQQTLFLRLPRLIKTAKPKPQEAPPQWSNLKKYLEQLPLPKKNQALPTTIDTLIHNPVNQYQSVLTSLEEIILIMEHDGVLPYFREYPLLASLGLALNFTTFLSFHLSIHTLPWIDKILVFLKQTNAAVGHAFFGQIIEHDFITSLATCFLCWQTTLFSVNLTQKVIAQEEIGWIKHLLQHQDGIVLSGSLLMLIGYVEAMLPLLPSQIRISDHLRLFNPLFALINFIHLEAKKCRHGQLPFSSLSLGIFGLKSSLFFLNLASRPATIPQPYPAKRLKDKSEAQKNLIGLFLGLYHEDVVVVHALSHPPIAKTYFLNLVQELKDYDKDFSIDKYPLLQQFYALYCQKRVPNILRLFMISLFPLHLLQWAYGHYKRNIEQIVSARHHSAEDLYLILEGLYLMIHPIVLILRIIIDYLLIPILSLGLQWLNAVLPTGKIKEQVFQLEDKLSNCNIQNIMINGLRPVQVLLAKLAFNAGIFPQLGPQTEYLIEKIQEQKTQIEDLGSVIKLR